MSIFSFFRARPSPGVEVDQSLARRLEEHVLYTSAEAHAYVDNRLAALDRGSAVSHEELARSSLLAVHEAKAYADDAVTSLGLSLRGVSRAVLELSRRVESETARSVDGETKEQLPETGQGELSSDKLAELGAQVRLVSTKDNAGPRMVETLERLEAALHELDAGIRASSGATAKIETLLGELRTTTGKADDNGACT